jgi:hypothetical protein
MSEGAPDSTRSRTRIMGACAIALQRFYKVAETLGTAKSLLRSGDFGSHPSLSW